MLGNLREKLSRTRQAFKQKFEELLQSDKPREEILKELAETLILADVGLPSTEKIIQAIEQRTKKNDSLATIKETLKEELVQILSRYVTSRNFDSSPQVLMFVGVNGGGKTTSIAKLAYRFKKEGNQVLLVAADTFRAAASEQLVLWGKKLNIQVMRGQAGADPASVVFDALRSFKAHNFDFLLIDTAGRIHTNTNLMNELEKMKRVISREVEGAPHGILLVLDASIGQNALVQAKEFLKFSGLTGIFLTKLDGTAKGGSIISIAEELRLPIQWIGIGETEKDMLEFSPRQFVEALLS